MLACREVSRLIAADEVRSAGFARRIAVRAHLMMCDKCRRFSRELKALGRALRSLRGDQFGAGGGTDDEVEAVERVVQRLAERPRGSA